MIEQRKLTNDELNRLILEAPDSETRNLFSCMAQLEMTPTDFFEQYALDYFGLVANGRPIYVAILTENENNDMEIWTVANSNIYEMMSLCKYAKRGFREWLDKYKRIFATMEDVNTKNIEWTKWIGFKEVERKDGLVTLCASSL